jgi:hypothetical protein
VALVSCRAAKLLEARTRATQRRKVSVPGAGVFATLRAKREDVCGKGDETGIDHWVRAEGWENAAVPSGGANRGVIRELVLRRVCGIEDSMPKRPNSARGDSGCRSLCEMVSSRDLRWCR